MSMEFSDMNQVGGGGLASGIALGGLMNRREDRGEYIWAVIIFAIIFIIALVFLAAFMRRDDHRKDYGTDIAATLTPLIAAKSMDGNGYKSCEIDKLYEKLEHSEDRARQTQTQQEIGALGKEFANIGFGLSGQIHCTDKTNLENFAKLENQLGMMSMGMTQLLQKSNNEDIIQGVINRLCGVPCFGKC